MLSTDTPHSESIDPVSFVEPDGGRSAERQSPGADRSAANMRSLQFPFTPDEAGRAGRW